MKKYRWLLLAVLLLQGSIKASDLDLLSAGDLEDFLSAGDLEDFLSASGFEGRDDNLTQSKSPADNKSKRFACPFEGCGATFITNSHLTRHTKTHSHS